MSTFVDGPGTLITLENETMEQAEVSGIAHAVDEAKIMSRVCRICSALPLKFWVL